PHFAYGRLVHSANEGGIGPEGMLNQGGVLRETTQVLDGSRRLSALAAVAEFQQQQLVQQRRPVRLGSIGQVFFDDRPLSGIPGVLEAVTGLVHTLKERQGDRVTCREPGLTHRPSSSWLSRSRVARMRCSFRSTLRTLRPSLAAISSLV